ASSAKSNAHWLSGSVPAHSATTPSQPNKVLLATGDPSLRPFRDEKRPVKVDVALSGDGFAPPGEGTGGDPLDFMGIGVAVRRAQPPVHWLSADDT
ncbi:hypothetical protein AB0B25_30915, partial [Nocardia sp. NPDC049190]|uniref:hypothetical protein n=1 Tax=Nocardia sp. NPDC049190 TaxID=3155650 RepID=UPI0033F3DFE1